MSQAPWVIPKSLYKKMHEVMPIACVDIVIVSYNKFLLFKRKNEPVKGCWWFAGGRILKNETSKKAAIRKTKEETGLKIKIEKMLGADETIFSTGPFGKPTHTVNFVFLAKPISNIKEITMDNQSDEFKWFEKINNNWHPYIKKFLREAGFK
jgi:colanic acid biosynthesis protein WcaH